MLPFANESGVSAVDAMALADQFAIEIDAVERMNCVPVNRAIAAMRAAGINSINSESDARTVLAILQVDAVLLGTVTAYDSYRPLQLGVAVRVISVERSDSATADATALTMATGEPRNQTTPGSPPPSLQVSRVYDANNHGTLSSVKAYAAGREDPKSGLRGTAYLVSMERYSRFVAYDVVRSLLAEEAARRASRPDLADAPTE
ncbi:MAG: hypothetical protein SGJ09_15140 [Phycisphaerae bacterium]|nr:hypothetical protein [Phycisphaerae bacterium]